MTVPFLAQIQRMQPVLTFAGQGSAEVAVTATRLLGAHLQALSAATGP
jgi:hypothetical protein